MGCCTSNISAANVTLDGFGNNQLDGGVVETPKRSASKRSYLSRISSASSGVSSRCTTPSRRSILSRQSGSKKYAPSRQLSICDDFSDGVKLQQQHQDLDKSVGYFTDSSPSTPSRMSLRHTQDMSGLQQDFEAICSLQEDSAYKPATSDLDMEMYMMTHADGLMQKTSSPLMQRKDITYVAAATTTTTEPASDTYCKWSQYLQSTPTYMLHNVTNIPEAIAGHFSPKDFPAFSDLDDMESLAKRYKVDVHAAEPAIGLTHTIASTEL